MMQQPQDTTVIQLDQLTDSIFASYCDDDQQEKRGQQEHINELKKQAITVFQTLLATEIDTALLRTFALTYKVSRDSNDLLQTEALLSYAGLIWHIRQIFSNRSKETWCWSIRTTPPANTSIRTWYNAQTPDLSVDVSPLMLRSTLPDLLYRWNRKQRGRSRHRTRTWLDGS